MYAISIAPVCADAVGTSETGASTQAMPARATILTIFMCVRSLTGGPKRPSGQPHSFPADLPRTLALNHQLPSCAVPSERYLHSVIHEARHMHSHASRTTLQGGSSQVLRA